MDPPLNLRDLVDALGEKLDLSWVVGAEYAESTILGRQTDAGNQAMVGYLNLIHPNRIQVVGRSELFYLAGLDPAAYEEALRTLFAAQPATILIADAITMDDSLVQAARENATPALVSPLSDNQILYEIQYYLSCALAQKVTLHGVFMEVMGTGILITGDAGVGKSELALELITRGHRLVADDAPQFSRIAPDILSGTCPPLLTDFLEVRGLGVLNVRAMFGDSAIKSSKYLRLIVRLQRMDNDLLASMDRLDGSYSEVTVLGVSVPQVIIPVAPGRSLAILVEAAVRNHVLRLKGYKASSDFAERQLSLLGIPG